jgi:hypothetical protein
MIEVLKQALKVLEQLDGIDTETECVTIDVGDEIAFLHKAIAELESQEPVCPECKAEVLYECVACSRNNYPPQHTLVGLTDEAITPASRAKERLIRIMGTFDLATGHADTFDELLDSLESELRDVLGYYRQQRTWVGLTDEGEILAISNTMPYADRFEFAKAIEAKLKEKNT